MLEHYVWTSVCTPAVGGMMETRYKHIELNEDHARSRACTTMKVVELVVEQQAYGWSP
jgi:hypothetical protein